MIATKIRFGVSLIFILSLMVGTAKAEGGGTADADKSCQKFLGSPSAKVHPQITKVFQRLEKLDPVFHRQLLDLDNNIDLYVALKKRAWKIMPFGMIDWRSDFKIDDELKALWMENFGKTYRILDLNPSQLVIFYVNQLQSIYGQVARVIIDDWAERLTTKHNIHDKDFKTRLAMAFQKSIGFDLRRPHTAPDLAEIELKKQDHDNLNLKLMYQAYTKLTFNYKSSRGELSVADIEADLKDQSLSATEKQLLIRVLRAQKSRLDEICCKNATGCIFCPNNLGFKIVN